MRIICRCVLCLLCARADVDFACVYTGTWLDGATKSDLRRLRVHSAIRFRDGGEKFIVAERRQRTSKRGVIGEHPDAVRARRAAARLAAQNDDRDDNGDDDGGAGENIESVIFDA
jgi:hypothetical protein